MDHGRFFNNHSSTSIIMMDTDELEDRYLDDREQEEADQQAPSFRTRGQTQPTQYPRALPFALAASSSSSFAIASASPKTPLYFGPGTSPSFRPRQRRDSRHRPRTLQQYQASPSQQPQQQFAHDINGSNSTPLASRTAESNADQSTAADPPPSSQKRARTMPQSTFGSASALASTAPGTPPSRAVAAPSTPSHGLAPTPAPTPSTSFAANFMLGILKSGPQMPLPPKGTSQRLAELAKSTDPGGRKASIAPGTVSSPLAEAKRAQLRKEFQERERKKKLERSRDLDDSLEENDASVGDVEMATGDSGKTPTGAGAGSKGRAAAVGRPKKPVSVLDIIERTAGSGMGLPPRPAASSFSSASISSLRPAERPTTESASVSTLAPATSSDDSASAPAKILRITDEGSSNATATPAFGASHAISTPSASSRPVPTLDFGKPNTNSTNATATPTVALLPAAAPSSSTSSILTPANAVSTGSSFNFNRPTTAPAPALPASQPTLNVTGSSAPSTISDSSASLPSFDFGLDATVKNILAAGGSANDPEAKTKAMSLDSSKLPAFTFTF